MTIKYLNQQNVKALLKTDPGVKTISAEAVQWIDDVVEQVAKNLAASGRKSPSGRLMGPHLDPGLMARTVAAKEPALGEGDCVIQEALPAQTPNIYETIAELVTGAAPGSLAGIKRTNPDLYLKVKAGVLAMQYLPPAKEADESGAAWSEYHDWQQQVRQGKSKLPFEEWKNEKKT